MSIDEHGFLELKLSGVLSGEKVKELRAEVDETTRVVEELFKKKRGLIRILLDITDFTGTYSMDAMMVMKQFATHNRPFVYRTGVFGGSDTARVAAEITVALAGRDNIRFFKTRADAMRWLSE